GPEARAAVWTGFLDRNNGRDGGDGGAGNRHSLTLDDIGRLARLDLNGRQIKNVLKSANLLAAHTGSSLTFDHVHTVLRVQGHEIGNKDQAGRGWMHRVDRRHL